MDLIIETLTGTTFDLRVSPSETVMSVKARIQTLEGIPISQQHLIFRDRELNDSVSLKDYAIPNGATLTLVLALRGGPINTRRLNVDEEATFDSVLDKASSAAEFVDSADYSDAEIFFERLADADTPSANGQPNAGSKMTLLVFRDGDQLSFFRLVGGHGEGTPTPRSGSASSKHQEERDDRLTTADDARSGQARDQAAGKKPPLTRSGSIPPPTWTKPCACCAQTQSTDDLPHAGTDVRGPQPGAPRRRAALHHSADCPLRGATEELRRFKENEDLRSTVRALRAKMASMRVNRQRLRTREAPSEQPASVTAQVQEPCMPTSDAGTGIAAPQTATTARPVVQETRPSTRGPPAALQSSNDPSERDKRNVEADRVLSSFKRHHHQALLEPIGVTRLRSSAAPTQSSRPTPMKPSMLDDKSSRTSAPDVAATPLHSTPGTIHLPAVRAPPASNRYRAPSGDRRLPPISSPRVSQEAPVPSVQKPAALNASIKSTISASINLLSALQQNAKAPPPATNAKQRCAFCGRKTGLATSYVCRCELNFCALHRYAEAHNCTFDYKAEGRRTLEQQNPLFVVPKLPKI